MFKELNLYLLRTATNFIRLEYDVKLTFGLWGGSEADMETEEIFIDLEECDSVDRFWSLVYHELAHVLCKREGKWAKYHSSNTPKSYMLKYGVRAEKYVDKRAEELLWQDHPRLNYIPAYATAEDVQLYKDWVRSL